MSLGPSSRANVPKPAGEAALEPNALQCAAHQAGRWRATRQVALIEKGTPRPLPELMQRIDATSKSFLSPEAANQGSQAPRTFPGLPKAPFFSPRLRTSCFKGQTQPKLVHAWSRKVHLFRMGRIQTRLHLKEAKGLEPDPNPTLHPSSLEWSDWKARRLPGKTKNEHKKPRARPGPKLAPAWYRQAQKTNKKTGARSGFERTLHP